MLTQLSRLNLQADGQYATDQELQFLEDYLNSAEQRIRTYEKIRENESSILVEVETKMHELNKNNSLFFMGQHEKEICRRDRQNAVRYSSAAMLINDLDRLRDGLLIWVQTIVRAVGYKYFVGTHYPIIQEVIKQYLTPEEAALILPALQIDCTILGA
ncbi:allophycocyanin [Aphanothece sacrum]|uniref:Phycobilisome protein n=1 Tax=Aphanothece sacrum FPU1 TaxID=1920663 RepID=A0A401IM34_APHSA|nr:allophycocyanin [Aphanothece sacrum]GBF82306.1 phycobilisome protein [Aphanothece sacrum FPU1]GBF84206.1 phycobilisome protein [Aphanothece sacrum FPU3]